MNTVSEVRAWRLEDVRRLYRQPLLELVGQARAVHCEAHPEAEVQLCHLLSIKTGGCPEDCAYCPQSARYESGVAASPLMETAAVLAAAESAHQAGATRFCMGAAWRQVREGPEFDRVLDMVRGVASLGLEVCCTLGMLTAAQAERLADAGLTAYNHNLDTSPEFYGEIVHTRKYEDRLRTLEHVRRAGITVCCGGILGMGESEDDRIGMLHVLANLRPQPESVPINALVAVEGTPLAARPPVAAFEFVRAIAAARILMPHSKVRLSAGRLSLSPEAQALCFLAGANSIFAGEKLLTTPNPAWDEDRALLATLGLEPEPPRASRLPAAPRPTPDLDRELQADLAALDARQRLRRLAPPAGSDFCSNDFLGLASHPAIRAAMQQALADGIALGSTGSRLVRGNHPGFETLERDFAAFAGFDAALLFANGYAANTALLATLPRSGDVVFSDAANHASLIDGLRLGRAARVVVPHNDPKALRARARNHPAAPGARRWLVVESVYSMEGDRAPLAELAAVCREENIVLIVDEAHAFGLLGPNGEGAIAEELAENPEGDLRRVLVAAVYPCGKALGASGAFVAGSRALREYLINHARPFIFSTAPPPLLAVQLAAALEILRTEPWRRAEVAALAAHLRAQLAALGLRSAAPNEDARLPIVPVVVGDDAAALALAATLQAAGFDVRAIRPPTVPEGTARLRLTVHAGQTRAEIERLPRLAPRLGGLRCQSRRPSRRPVTGLFVAGTSTGVGKTVVAALLTLALEADYWKPVQSGRDPLTDRERVERLTGLEPARLHPEAYVFDLPASPHLAAAAEGRTIHPQNLRPPPTPRPLIVEAAGGLLVPLNWRDTMLDLALWIGRPVVLVSTTHLGAINHTLLSLAALRARGVPVAGVVLNGAPAPGLEATLRHFADAPLAGRLSPLPRLDAPALRAAAHQLDLDRLRRAALS